MGSDAMIYIIGFIKTGAGVQKLIGGIHRHTHRHTERKTDGRDL
jgi:hypothetical protein